MSYSLGGTDYPLPYGTPLPAPAAGTLHTSGGAGEFRCGWVGTAGRRSILILDEPVGDVVAIVFQHQSAMGVDLGHYAEGEILGYSGASASGDDHGAEIHLHIHDLDKAGARLQFETHLGNSSTALAGETTLHNAKEDDDMPTIIKEIGVPEGTARYGVYPTRSGFTHIATMEDVRAILVPLDLVGGTDPKVLEDQHVRGVNPSEFDAIARVYQS